VGSEQVELDDHSVVRVMENRVLVALVGKRGAGRPVVLGDLVRPVVDVARGHDLVARVVESLERGVELVPVLRLHVLANLRLATLGQGLRAFHSFLLLAGIGILAKEEGSWSPLRG
jgi:hypothetical protein